MAAALAAAITVRDYVIEQLALHPNEPRTIYDEAKRIAPPDTVRRGGAGALTYRGDTPTRVERVERRGDETL